MKGAVMLILFIASFFLFVGVTFWYLNSEDSNGKSALTKAAGVGDRVEVLNANIQQLRRDLSYQLEQLRTNAECAQVISDKLKNKIEWLEMKANSQAQLSSKPIQVSVVYRKAQPKVTTTALKPGPGVLKEIKKNLNKLSN